MTEFLRGWVFVQPCQQIGHGQRAGTSRASCNLNTQRRAVSKMTYYFDIPTSTWKAIGDQRGHIAAALAGAAKPGTRHYQPAL